MRLNNKGQSLVMFILIIPILLLIMVLVIDIGNVMYNKQNVDDITKIVIDYGLEHINDTDVVMEMSKLAGLNDNDIKIEIGFEDMEFYVTSTYYVDGIFSNIMNVDGYLVKSIYKGYIDSDGKNIKVKIK